MIDLTIILYTIAVAGMFGTLMWSHYDSHKPKKTKTQESQS